MAVAKADIAPLGKGMYARLRPQLEAKHWGKMVVIDVNSGDYEIADDDLTATLRLFERRPEALTWGERVGCRAPYFMGRAYSVPARRAQPGRPGLAAGPGPFRSS